MPDPQPSRPRGQTDDQRHHAGQPETGDRRGFFERIAGFISPGPENREDLNEAIEDAEKNGVIDSETQVMIEGALRLSDLTAGDVMVPAQRMEMLDIGQSVEDLMDAVIDSGHSRFPVYEHKEGSDTDDRENIIGILLAKDLLKLSRAPEFSVRALLRQPVFVPESRSLNQMLTDFRTNRHHMAVVVDEFGRIAGLLTIEDVLEEIVGEIEDEFDVDVDEGEIYALSDGSFRVAGDTPLERMNEAFGESYASDAVESIGGLIAHDLGHVPRRGESAVQGHLRFTVLHTRSGRVRWFKVRPVTKTRPLSPASVSASSVVS